MLVASACSAGDGAPAARAKATSKTKAPETAALQLAEPRASHTATLRSDGTILIVGGFRKGPDGRSQIYARSSEVIDPAHGTVTAGPAMAEARSGHLAVLLGDGSLLVAGGWGEAGALRSAERLDPATGRWERVGDLGATRGGSTATLLEGGAVLIAGGGDDDTKHDSLELYDASKRAFRPAGRLAAPRQGHTATLLADGRVLLAGGETRGGSVVATAEVYDPATGKATAAGSMAGPRYKHAAVRLGDGRVLLVGGSDERDWRGKYATTEIFDPATGQFAPGPALSAARFKLPSAVVALPGGQVAVAGGADSVELIDPTGQSRVVAQLDGARYFSTATLLSTGALLLVGGYGDDIRATDQIRAIEL